MQLRPELTPRENVAARMEAAGKEVPDEMYMSKGAAVVQLWKIKSRHPRYKLAQKVSAW